MGLTIHYTLALENGGEAEARAVVEQLRQRALDLPLRHVGDILDLSGDAANFDKAPKDDPQRWLLVQAMHYVERGSSYTSVPPTRIIAFATHPAAGCEAANFGLCQYPAGTAFSRAGGKRRVASIAPAWWWRSCCKTQYASAPAVGGVENFLRGHLAVVAMLDVAQELGILADVSDESDYWQKRAVEALTREIGKWNQMMAAVAGQMKDKIGDRVKGAIFGYPNFEHLEAEGRREEE